MGNIWWWIAASVAYGILSGALLLWMRHRKGQPIRWLPVAIPAAIYTVVALTCVWALWVVFSL